MMNLKNFLSKHQATSETNVTCLSGSWGGKWFIPKDQYKTFLNSYFAAISEGGGILRLVEKKSKNDEHYRLCADIDIPADLLNSGDAKKCITHLQFVKALNYTKKLKEGFGQIK
jgi:hypothetical protein